MLLEQGKVKIIQTQAKLQEHDFLSQKQIASLKLKVAQLMCVKSTAGFKVSNQASPTKIQIIEGDEEDEDYCQEDAQLDVIE